MPPVASSDVEMPDAPHGPSRDVETASIGSSQTLVGAGASGTRNSMDVNMDATQKSEDPVVVGTAEITSPTTSKSQGAEENTAKTGATITTYTPSDMDEIVLKGLEHQDRSSGTEQQDVEEVIGSMINKLQAAIVPTSTDAETGIQMEKIMETFFVTTINYTKKFDEEQYQTEISFDRSITAFPAPDGPCSLYEALGRNFDQQMLDDSRLSRYTSIKSLPPILHVLIQRSQSIGQKNNNAVQIPETLYLDRFMDAPHDSEAFKRRVVEWSISSRLSDVRTSKLLCSGMPQSHQLIEKLMENMDQPDGPDAKLRELVNNPSPKRSRPEEWDFDSAADEAKLLESSVPDASGFCDHPSPPKKVRSCEEETLKSMQREADYLERTLNDHFADQEAIPYRLQAVICHRGAMSSGHYWVWIHDFEQDVWRKYNDETVEVMADTNTVLQTLCSSGEPYYLCYVRDSDKDTHVNVPKRDPNPCGDISNGDASMELSVPSMIDLDKDDRSTLSTASHDVGETELITFDDEPAKHVEHVEISPAEYIN